MASKATMSTTHFVKICPPADTHTGTRVEASMPVHWQRTWVYDHIAHDYFLRKGK